MASIGTAEATKPTSAGAEPLRVLQYAGVILIVVAAGLLPLVLTNYQLLQMTLVLVSAVAILGLNLVTGYNGQISLGHGAFYAVGAYVTAILVATFGLPYWLALPLAGVASFVVGFVFGMPALRLDGLYLALATFSLGIATPQLAKSKQLSPWTGGSFGISIHKPAPPAGLPLNADQWIYLFTLAVAVLVFLASWNLLRGRIGRAIRAIRDHPLAAEAMGINIARYKTLTFALSAAFTGVAGSLSLIALQYVSPDAFTVFLSITLLVGVVVGGLASISGAIWGALFIEMVPNLADDVSKAAPWAVYGVFLIVVVFVMPNGIAGFLRALVHQARRLMWRQQKEAQP